jgi:hypothetical protein
VIIAANPTEIQTKYVRNSYKYYCFTSPLGAWKLFWQNTFMGFAAISAQISGFIILEWAIFFPYCHNHFHVLNSAAQSKISDCRHAAQQLSLGECSSSSSDVRWICLIWCVFRVSSCSELQFLDWWEMGGISLQLVILWRHRTANEKCVTSWCAVASETERLNDLRVSWSFCYLISHTSTEQTRGFHESVLSRAPDINITIH